MFASQATVDFAAGLEKAVELDRNQLALVVEFDQSQMQGRLQAKLCLAFGKIGAFGAQKWYQLSDLTRSVTERMIQNVISFEAIQQGAQGKRIALVGGESAPEERLRDLPALIALFRVESCQERRIVRD